MLREVRHVVKILFQPSVFLCPPDRLLSRPALSPQFAVFCLSKRTRYRPKWGHCTRLCLHSNGDILGALVTVDSLWNLWEKKKKRKEEKATRRANSSWLCSHTWPKSIPTLVKVWVAECRMREWKRSCVEEFLFHDINYLFFPSVLHQELLLQMVFTAYGDMNLIFSILHYLFLKTSPLSYTRHTHCLMPSMLSYICWLHPAVIWVPVAWSAHADLWPLTSSSTELQLSGYVPFFFFNLKEMGVPVLTSQSISSSELLNHSVQPIWDQQPCPPRSKSL